SPSMTIPSSVHSIFTSSFVMPGSSAVIPCCRHARGLRRQGTIPPKPQSPVQHPRRYQKCGPIPPKNASSRRTDLSSRKAWRFPEKDNTPAARQGFVLSRFVLSRFVLCRLVLCRLVLYQRTIGFVASLLA